MTCEGEILELTSKISRTLELDSYLNREIPLLRSYINTTLELDSFVNKTLPLESNFDLEES